MPKRFHATELWDEDWFLALPEGYMLLWFWVKDKCDHAGIWKPNITTFKNATQKHVELKKALELFNADGKERVRVLPNGRWFIPGFFAFQYGVKINPKNPVHASILVVLEKNNLSVSDLLGVTEVGAGSPRGRSEVGDGNEDKKSNQHGHTAPEHKNIGKFPPCQDHFYKKFKDVMGKAYVANFGKDGAIFKDLIAVIGDDDVIKAVDRFFISEDDFIKKSGYTVGVFKSQINKLVGDKKKSSLIFKQE
jgi:hypothetical protein